ncbi:GNAT family N-acetyltransferase [Nocardia sp. NPDC059177]|uniref:GNAT family N-acetyltransferase n=1 Tax=Nocardia sp. NPDC059177 TaxID=3346759 RepID=UPI00368A2D6A
MAGTVREATRADVRAVAATLAAAFQDDPVTCWLLPDPRRRAAGIPRFFAAVARHVYVPLGGAELAADPDGTAAGAALWAPPDRWQTSPGTDLRLAPSLIRAFGRRSRAGGELSDLMKQHHPTEPHWYLSMIGTTPQARGGGHGQALLRSRLDRVDAVGSPAYLESSNPDNIGYYERFGFTVTGEIQIPGGPKLWPMWRPATTA